MRLIIAGSRTVSPSDCAITAALLDHFGSSVVVTEVVSGTAAGADLAGEGWARRASIPIRRFPADWTKHGKAAGPIRNRAMAAYADAALIFWDGESRGSANMIAEMQRLGKPVHVVTMKGDWRDDG